jgi:hypothetical protein
MAAVGVALLCAVSAILSSCVPQRRISEEAGIADSHINYAPPPSIGFELGMPLLDAEKSHPNLRLLSNPVTVNWAGAMRITGPTSCPSNETGGGCKNATLETQSDAGGVAVLAIYYDEADPGFTKGVRFGNGALLVPFLIHVCAEYSGRSSVPNSAPKEARVCGIYGFHHTRTTETGDPKETAYNVPMYERVLGALMETYGHPIDYQPRAQIVIVPPPPDRSPGAQPRFVDYHWGRDRDDVNISFAYDPGTGLGVAWWSTRAVRRFARTYHDLGDVDFTLYRLLQPGRLNRHEGRFQDERTLCRVGCDGEPEPPDRRLRALFEPHLE